MVKEGWRGTGREKGGERRDRGGNEEDEGGWEGRKEGDFLNTY